MVRCRTTRPERDPSVSRFYPVSGHRASCRHRDEPSSANQNRFANANACSHLIVHIVRYPDARYNVLERASGYVGHRIVSHLVACPDTQERRGRG